MRAANVIGSFVTVLAAPIAAAACPVCDTVTGDDVRAGIFNNDFARTAILTLLPFPVLLSVVALIHFGIPDLGQFRLPRSGRCRKEK